MGEKPGVAIVIDGVPVQERAGSVNIVMDNVESIKIIKGGASYLYGNDALAGAIVANHTVNFYCIFSIDHCITY